MSRVTETEIKNLTNGFFDDMIKIKDLDPDNIKTEKVIQKYFYLQHCLCNTK